MKDEQKLKEFAVTKNPHILTFITPPKNKVSLSQEEISGSKPSLTDPNQQNNREETYPDNSREPLNNDFEYYRDKFGFTDEEMNWKRFCFHGGYSLGAFVYQINDNNLVIRESEWLTNQDPELRSKPDQFKAVNFHDKNFFSQMDWLPRNMLIFVFIVIFSFVIGWPFALTIHWMKKKSHVLG